MTKKQYEKKMLELLNKPRNTETFLQTYKLALNFHLNNKDLTKRVIIWLKKKLYK